MSDYLHIHNTNFEKEHHLFLLFIPILVFFIVALFYFLGPRKATISSDESIKIENIVQEQISPNVLGKDYNLDK